MIDRTPEEERQIVFELNCRFWEKISLRGGEKMNQRDQLLSCLASLAQTLNELPLIKAWRFRADQQTIETVIHEIQNVEEFIDCMIEDVQYKVKK